MRVKFIQFAIIAGLCSQGAAGETTSGNPRNLLWIILDDLAPSYRAYQPAGYPYTPNINRLLDESTEFLNAYCNYPSCGPSRASFLSGLPPTSTGYRANHTASGVNVRQAMPHVQFAPQLFNEQGYEVSGVGKIFHPGDPIHNDTKVFDAYEGTVNLVAPVYTNYEYRTMGVTAYEISSDSQLQTGRIADKAVEYLANAPINSPWMIQVGFFKPHLPWHMAREDFDAVDPDTLNLPPETTLASQNWPNGFTMINQPIDPDAVRRSLIRGYMACVRMVDRQIGRLFAAMDADPERYWDNTVVVFQSDHGFFLGEHQTRWQKNSPLEESVHSPLAIRVPGLASNRVENVVQFIDIYPTLIDVCNIDPPWHSLPGQSLLPLMIDPDQPTGWTDRPAISIVHSGTPRQYRVTSATHNYAISWYTQQAHGNTANLYLIDRVAERLDWNGYPLVQEQSILRGSAYNTIRQTMYEHLLPEFALSNSVNWTTSSNYLTQDPDGDGVKSYDELVMGTYPHIADSDEDGATDGEEFYAAGPAPRLLGIAGNPPYASSTNGPTGEDIWMIWSQPQTTGASYALQRSTDLDQWSTVSTHSREFISDVSSNGPHAFYRVHADP